MHTHYFLETHRKVDDAVFFESVVTSLICSVPKLLNKLLLRGVSTVQHGDKQQLLLVVSVLSAIIGL